MIFLAKLGITSNRVMLPFEMLTRKVRKEHEFLRLTELVPAVSATCPCRKYLRKEQP